GEGEREPRLKAGAGKLGLAVEGKDVIAEDIGLPVMLVEPRALAPVNNIVLQHDTGAAFVSIKPPAAVAKDIDVVYQVVANDRAGLDAQSVNSTHVAQAPLADVVQVIEFDDVALAGPIAVTPRPTDRNRGVKS